MVDRTLEDTAIIALEANQLEEGACASQVSAQDLAEGVDAVLPECEEMNSSEPPFPDGSPADRTRLPVR